MKVRNELQRTIVVRDGVRRIEGEVRVRGIEAGRLTVRDVQPRALIVNDDLGERRIAIRGGGGGIGLALALAPIAAYVTTRAFGRRRR